MLQTMMELYRRPRPRAVRRIGWTEPHYRISGESDRSPDEAHLDLITTFWEAFCIEITLHAMGFPHGTVRYASGVKTEAPWLTVVLTDGERGVFWILKNTPLPSHESFHALLKEMVALWESMPPATRNEIYAQSSALERAETLAADIRDAGITIPSPIQRAEA